MAERLVATIKQVGATLVTKVAYGDDVVATGEVPLARTMTDRPPAADPSDEFLGAVALPALLKLLDADEYTAADFDPEERAFLQDERLVARSMRRVQRAENLYRQVGERLFRCLFPPDKPLSIFEQAARDANQRLHLELELPADDTFVGALPWELLYHDGFLADENGIISRRLQYDRRAPSAEPLAVDKVRVLVVTPRPTDVPQLTQADVQVLRDIKERLEIKEIEPVFSVFRDYLQDHRGADAPHVIHFDGHGAYGRKCGTCQSLSGRRAPKCRNPRCQKSRLERDAQGYLGWQNADGTVDYVSAEDMAIPIAATTAENDSCVRLVVLSACRSAAVVGGETVFSGAAQRLIRARVPAVVAMQFEIDADSARGFARAMYRSLVAGDPITRALVYGRSSMRRDRGQWFRPVLYLRTRADADPDAQFFTFVNPARSSPAVDAQDIRTLNGRAAAAANPTIESVIASIRLLTNTQHLPTRLVDFRTDLEAAHAQLAVMDDYKALHDGLHQIYLFGYKPIRKALPAFDNPLVLETCGSYALDIHKAVERMQDILKQGRIQTAAIPWLSMLAQDDQLLRQGITAQNARIVRTTIDLLGHILDSQPERINDSIKLAAANVRLDKLGEALASAATSSTGGASISATDAAVVRSGADSVARVWQQLRTLLEEHSLWQYLDAELRNLEKFLEHAEDRPSFALSWPPARTQIEQLCDKSREDWAVSLVAASASIDAELAGLGAGSLVDGFDRVRGGADQRFFTVDKRLRELCNGLVKLGEPLDALVERIDSCALTCA
jgi:CHAT domain